MQYPKPKPHQVGDLFLTNNEIFVKLTEISSKGYKFKEVKKQPGALTSFTFTIESVNVGIYNNGYWTDVDIKDWIKVPKICEDLYE